MTEKDIRIFLRSERYEVEASLFSSVEDEGELLSLLTSAAEQGPESFEIRSCGKLLDEAQLQVSKIVPGADGAPMEEAFTDEQ